MKIFELHDPLFLPHCGCDLQLPIKLGSSTVLIGENGIGKTTLLHRLSSSVSSDSRAVVEQKTSEYFFDRKLFTLKKIFCEENLRQFNRSDFLSLWNDFELNKKEDRMLSHLSGGESQALKLCLSLSKVCEFYFLDEPSQFLDGAKKKILVHFLEKLKNSGKTLIIIEHNRDWIPPGWMVQKLVIDKDFLRLGEKWIT